MSREARPILAKELAQKLNAHYEGPEGLVLKGVATLNEASLSDLSFLTNPKYAKVANTSKAGCLLLSPEQGEAFKGAKIISQNPYLALARAVELFYPPHKLKPGVSPLAFVHPKAYVDQGAFIGPFCVIEQGAKVLEGSRLLSHVFVGREVIIGKDCLIHPHVSILEGTVLGERVILQSGCVVGSDGFGFAFDPKTKAYEKIPQVGHVEVGSDVELGACVTVARAFLGTTRIGEGTKVDNLVQIGHNVEIGQSCILVSQVGISGSTSIGNHVVLAGQVGVVGHIRIEDGVIVGAGSGVHRDLKANKTYWGFPAVEHKRALARHGALEKLPEMRKQFFELKKRLEALERRLEEGGSGNSEGFE
jgi:UDP-3-O-[3-hydroxymyristoyl] glucosamine N-acyltransferase